MRRMSLMLSVGIGLCLGSWALGADIGGTSLAQGWSLIREGGVAEGKVEPNAHNPSSTDQHLLRIEVTKTAKPGEGRVGAASSVRMSVRDNTWYDVTFSAVTESGSIGLVFSLENAEGKILARTTLPEIGRRPGRGDPGAATAPATWTQYLVSLHTQGSDPSVHVVITPIEPTNVWLQGLMIHERDAQ